VTRRPETPPLPAADPDDHAAYLAEIKASSRTRATPARKPGGLVALSTVTPKRVQWLWRGYLPAGKLSMLDGDPNVGKSTLAVDFAARITTGRPWPDGERCRVGNVIIMTAEDGVADTVLPRFLAAGGDPERVSRLEYVETDDGGPRSPLLPRDIPVITEYIREHRARLVIIDVLAAYWDSTVNPNRDNEVRRALSKLSDMAEATGAAVLALRHLNKQGDVKNAMYRGGGSIGITGHARAVHIAAVDPDDKTHERRILAPVKLNIAKMPSPLAYSLIPDDKYDCARVQWLGTDPHTAAALLDSPSDEDREDSDEAGEFLLDFLRHAKNQTAPYAEIMAAARKHGIAERTLKRARRNLGVTYIRAGYQLGTVWTLNPPEPLPFDGR
jgi:hypothetical protein